MQVRLFLFVDQTDMYSENILGIIILASLVFDSVPSLYRFFRNVILLYFWYTISAGESLGALICTMKALTL